MLSRSRLIHYASLGAAAVAVFCIATWVALNAIEAVPVPPVPPSKADVTFDPKGDVRSHPLFNTLRTLTRGNVMAGMLGKQNPFLGGSGSAEALKQSARTLGTIQEVSLGGGRVVAISRGSQAGITVLAQQPSGAYEVWRFTRDGTSQSVGSWSVTSGDAGITPVAVQEDRNGTVWLLSSTGRIGSLQSDGRPLWGSVPVEGIQAPVSASQAAFELDGAGRMWFTDGQSVFVGNGIGFQRIDLEAQLTSSNRQALGVSEGAPLSADITAPRRLQALADGRIAVLTARLTAAFPLNLQGAAEVVVPRGGVVAMEPNGALWSTVRNTTGEVTEWVRTAQGSAQSFTSLVVLPKQAANTARLAAGGSESVYAVDYTPGASVLWSTREGTWVASVLSPEGAQPQDQVERIVVDQEEGVWAILAQRGLLLIHPSE